MTLQDLRGAISECNDGILTFNLGEARAFLYEKKWYPLRATINRALEIANQDHDLTTDRALVQLTFLGFWTRVQKVNFQSQLPVEVILSEKINEIKKLAEAIKELVN